MGASARERIRSIRSSLRPRLRTVFVIVNAVLLLLPLSGLVVLRFYESVLVRRTEGELIAQGVAIASAFRMEMRREHDALGLELTGPRVVPPAPRDGADVDPEGRFHPIVARLDLSRDEILPDGPYPFPGPPADPIARVVGGRIQQLLVETQDATLAGIRVTDAQGVIVASTSDGIGLSITDREEVQAALRGEVASVLRAKSAEVPEHELGSISRNAGMRVLVALPVLDGDTLIGTVVAVRTPPSVRQVLWRGRRLVLGLTAALVAAAVVIGFLTSRVVARPIEELTHRAERVAAGESRSAKPLEHPGTHEIERLSEAVSSMARALDERAEYLASFAAHVSHEFKTPLASLRATAELVREHGHDMTPEERERFLGNMDRDSRRLDLLVGRLVEQARADMSRPTESRTALLPVVERAITPFRAEGVDVAFERDEGTPSVRAGADAVEAIVTNLVDNARRHGGPSVRVVVSARAEARDGAPGASIVVRDDGPGISAANVERAFTPFFTTARERGGTGLGLSIVRALATTSGGEVTLTSRPGCTEVTAWLPA